MLSAIMHPGSGLGNQLHRYVAARVLAKDKNLPFGVIAPEYFKGGEFMKLDIGEPIECAYTVKEGGRLYPLSRMTMWEEKKVVENGVDIRGYDPEINFVEDNTIIDGEFQDERYFAHRMDEVNEWLKVDFLGMPNDVCVIGFRGGEFRGIPDLFLPNEYWEHAIGIMRLINPAMKFWVVTDDPEFARDFFPSEVRVFHDIGSDWRMIRHAKYLIISNSSFYILPSLLNQHVNKVIAPRFWGRHNTGVWAMPQNWYKKFHYV